MKNSIFFILISAFTISNQLLNAQVAAIRISNATIVSGTTLQFDLEIQASVGTIYLGNADIKFRLDATKFSSPAISRVSSTSTLLSTTDANVGSSYVPASSFTAANEITVNINTPAPADQTDFDERVAKITSTFSRIASFRITNFNGGTAAASGFACQPIGTIIYTIAPTGTFQETAVMTDCNVLLPLELTDFTGKEMKEANVLNWETATERDVSHFEIEKSKGDNKRFLKIANVKAIGNATTPQYYTVSDSSPSNLDYYRMKMMDNDGQFTYSKTISIARKNDVKIDYYPNPASSFVNIQLEVKKYKFVTIDLLDVTGKVIATQSKGRDKGDNTSFVLNVEHIPNGIYTAAVTIDGVLSFHKIAVAK